MNRLKILVRSLMVCCTVAAVMGTLAVSTLAEEEVFSSDKAEEHGHLKKKRQPESDSGFCGPMVILRIMWFM